MESHEEPVSKEPETGQGTSRPVAEATARPGPEKAMAGKEGQRAWWPLAEESGQPGAVAQEGGMVTILVQPTGGGTRPTLEDTP